MIPKKNRNAWKEPELRASKNLNIRVKCSDLNQWRRTAANAGTTLSKWVIFNLNREQ